MRDQSHIRLSLFFMFLLLNMWKVAVTIGWGKIRFIDTQAIYVK